MSVYYHECYLDISLKIPNDAVYLFVNSEVDHNHLYAYLPGILDGDRSLFDIINSNWHVPKDHIAFAGSDFDSTTVYPHNQQNEDGGTAIDTNCHLSHTFQDAANFVERKHYYSHEDDALFVLACNFDLRRVCCILD